MEDSRNIIKAIDALTLKAGGEAVDSKNITEAIDNLNNVVYKIRKISVTANNIQSAINGAIDSVKDSMGTYLFDFTWNQHYTGTLIATVHNLSPRVTFCLFPQLQNTGNIIYAGTREGDGTRIASFKGEEVRSS